MKTFIVFGGRKGQSTIVQAQNMAEAIYEAYSQLPDEYGRTDPSLISMIWPEWPANPVKIN